MSWDKQGNIAGPVIPATATTLGAVKGGADIAIAADGTASIGKPTALSVVTNNSAAWPQVWIAQWDNGTGRSAAPAKDSLAQFYLKIGGNEWGANSYRSIGFGYAPGPAAWPAASITYEEMSTSGNDAGDLLIMTRPGTNNVQPTERLRVTKDGQITAPVAYVPKTDGDLANKGYVDKAAAKPITTLSISDYIPQTIFSPNFQWTYRIPYQELNLTEGTWIVKASMSGLVYGQIDSSLVSVRCVIREKQYALDNETLSPPLWSEGVAGSLGNAMAADYIAQVDKNGMTICNCYCVVYDSSDKSAVTDVRIAGMLTAVRIGDFTPTPTSTSAMYMADVPAGSTSYDIVQTFDPPLADPSQFTSLFEKWMAQSPFNNGEWSTVDGDVVDFPGQISSDGLHITGIPDDITEDHQLVYALKQSYQGEELILTGNVYVPGSTYVFLTVKAPS